MGEDIAHDAREGALIVDLAVELIEVGAGLRIDLVAPQIDELLRGGRRRLAREALAHHERDRVLERRIGAVGDVLIFGAAMIAVLQHGGEVRGDALHALRADRLDARLLDRNRRARAPRALAARGADARRDRDRQA